ncbi:hypothetical protein QOT17_005022 [Balamuthia mandrillaris]
MARHATIVAFYSLLWLCSMAAANTGYFQAGASGETCTATDPCDNPFAPEMVFDEYVLAAGEYQMPQFTNITRSVTYRGWLEKGEATRPVIKGSTGGLGGLVEACFSLQYLNLESFNLTFSHLVVECSGIAFLFRVTVPINVVVHDLLIQGANGGFVLVHEAPPNQHSKLDMKNFEMRGLTCGGDNYKEPLALYHVDWTFGSVALADSCIENDKVLTRLQDCDAKSSGGALIYQGNHAGTRPVLELLGTTTVTMDGADMLFEDIACSDVVNLQGSSSLQTNGRVSFKRNIVSGHYFNFVSGSTALRSFLAIDFQESDDTNIFQVADDASVVCFTPCEGASCDCNDFPVVAWDIPSPSLQFLSPQGSLALPLLSHFPAGEGSLQLHLYLELSAGLFYGEHFVTEPSPTDPTSASSVLNVTIEVSRNEQARLAITRLPTSRRDVATITIQAVPPDPFTASFFLDMDSFIEVSLQPTFQPSDSTLFVSFPTENAPDHTLSLLDPQNNNQPLLNRSVSAQFATLKEVDEEGRVVALASLQEREFVVEELGNTTFNLNHALPFISFSTNISSLLTVAGEGGGGEGSMEQRNLTESIAMKVEFTMFAEEQVMSFAGVEQVMAANTLKWSLLLSSWPFQHRTHSLQLHLSLSSQDGVISLRSQEQSQENAVWMLKLGTENTEIPLNVLPLAVLLLNDPEEEAAVVEVGVEWEEEEEKLVITLPWFAQGSSLLLDPDMSLLVDEKEEDEDEDDDGLWWKITIPVVLFVVAVAVGAVLVVLVLQKKASRKTIRLRTTVNY